MKLSAESHHLLSKAIRRRQNPLEIIGCALMATTAFALVYDCTSSGLRYSSMILAYLIGPGVICLLALGTSYLAYQRRQRLWIAISICLWAALVIGVVLGEQTYWRYTVHGHGYEDLASYVNVDPSKDSGQSYMDAGRVYFKENSYVLRTNASAFRDGALYCAAPIVRNMEGNTNQAFTRAVGTPPSGTFDFWAVGKNCCPTSGYGFTCGEVESPAARSGLRIISTTERNFYLLATKAWSAQYNQYAKHPLFFTWVKDTLRYERSMRDSARSSWWTWTLVFFLVSFFVSFLINMFLQKLRYQN